MASKEWAGFTDEDIIRMQRESGTHQTCSEESVEGHIKSFTSQVKPTKLGFTKKVAQKRKARSFNRGVSSNGTTIPDQLQPGFHFGSNSTNYTQNPSSHNDTITPVLNVQVNTHTFDNSKINNADLNVANNGYVEIPSNDFEEYTKIDSSELDEKNIDKRPAETLDVRLNVLEQFELRQKQMEEENAKRTALLAKAIADRKKRTQAETVKLAKIQEELIHLDALLSVDVSVLRNQIEVASLAFSEAEKRYQKAEKEFVDAKIELFKKMERKEQLTEYLCTIIEQNEIRKGRKLAELMEQLEMDSLIQECEVNGMGPLLSQLCILNDVAYKCCSTIKPPASKSEMDESKTDSDKEGEKQNQCVEESDHIDSSSADLQNNTIENQNVVQEDLVEENIPKEDTEETEIVS